MARCCATRVLHSRDKQFALSTRDVIRMVSYSIEAVIAVIIIATAALPVLSTSAGSVDFAKAESYQRLQFLSADAEFREFVYENNVQSLESMLEGHFDNFEFEICAPDCSGPQRLSKETIIADWHFAGYRDANQPRTLRLYLFR